MPFKSNRLVQLSLSPFSIPRLSTSVFHPILFSFQFANNNRAKLTGTTTTITAIITITTTTTIATTTNWSPLVWTRLCSIDDDHLDGRWKFIRTYIAAAYTLEAFSPIYVPPIYGPRQLPLSAPILIIINDCRPSRGNSAATRLFRGAEVSSIRERIREEFWPTREEGKQVGISL